jgi:hypothetical protein
LNYKVREKIDYLITWGDLNLISDEEGTKVNVGLGVDDDAPSAESASAGEFGLEEATDDGLESLKTVKKLWIFELILIWKTCTNYCILAYRFKILTNKNR